MEELKKVVFVIITLINTVVFLLFFSWFYNILENYNTARKSSYVTATGVLPAPWLAPGGGGGGWYPSGLSDRMRTVIIWHKRASRPYLWTGTVALETL